MAGETVDDAALQARVRELLAATPDLGYRALHASLQAEASFKGVGLKRVQKCLRDVKSSEPPDLRSNDESKPCGSLAEESTRVSNGTAKPADGAHVAEGFCELTVRRPNLELKFGMMIAVEQSSSGGHAVTEIRPGGVVDEWNRSNPASSIRKDDVIVSVNGKTAFDDMMNEFKMSLACTLKLLDSRAAVQNEPLVVDKSEAVKEATEWEQRKARVTAALIPGLKKIIASEFGPGADERIGRVEQMYLRIGRNEVYEDDSALGRRYAPGYIEGLTPVQPFHDVALYPWCADLKRQWKAIREELRKSLDESLWKPGAYAASNEAYGKDWKIMGVLTSDTWQDEVRFKVTTNAIKGLQGISPFEAFFARMPPRTVIAPHSDNLSYVVTSHLALDLVEGQCSIRVGNEERYWKEGEMLVLDTTFIHSTKNESDRPRYVLVLRFWHPGLSEEEMRALHLSHAILASTAKK